MKYKKQKTLSIAMFGQRAPSDPLGGGIEVVVTERATRMAVLAAWLIALKFCSGGVKIRQPVCDEGLQWCCLFIIYPKCKNRNWKRRRQLSMPRDS